MPSPFVELEVGERIVKVTNPDKVLFPARGERSSIWCYYLSVGEGIVRALYERPTQLRRFPDGVEGEQIYQKRVPRSGRTGSRSLASRSLQGATRTSSA